MKYNVKLFDWVLVVEERERERDKCIGLNFDASNFDFVIDVWLVGKFKCVVLYSQTSPSPIFVHVGSKNIKYMQHKIQNMNLIDIYDELVHCASFKIDSK